MSQAEYSSFRKLLSMKARVQRWVRSDMSDARFSHTSADHTQIMNVATWNLIRAFGSLNPPSKENFAVGEIQQEELTQVLLADQHFRTYPPSSSHRRKFWKGLIESLESAGEEVDASIYEEYLALISELSTVPKCKLLPDLLERGVLTRLHVESLQLALALRNHAI